MIVVTTYASNIAIDVIKNGKVETILSNKKYEVLESELLTDSIINLSNLRLIGYAEVDNKVEENTSNKKRGRKHNSNNEQSSSEENTPSEEVKSEDTINPDNESINKEE